MKMCHVNTLSPGWSVTRRAGGWHQTESTLGLFKWEGFVLWEGWYNCLCLTYNGYSLAGGRLSTYISTLTHGISVSYLA